jgi:mono/diheme cytochrome c family protein
MYFSAETDCVTAGRSISHQADGMEVAFLFFAHALEHVACPRARAWHRQYPVTVGKRCSLCHGSPGMKSLPRIVYKNPACARRCGSTGRRREHVVKSVLIIIETVFATLAALLMVGVIGAAGFVYAGVYDVAATKHHTALTFHLLHYAMQRSVKARSDHVHVPALEGRERLDSGVMLYRQHCVQCHGGPGVAPEPFALGLRPAPVNLLEPGRDWPAGDIYWIVKHGVKMTAMPGWQYRLTENELWDLVAFVKHMSTVSPEEYRNWKPAPQVPPGGVKQQAALASSEPRNHIGSPAAGLHAIYQYMCVTCHAIPGTDNGKPNVGPALDGIAKRRYIGGVLLNTPENMVRWLSNPQAVDPMSAMPNLGLREQDARDIASYLYTLK